MKTNFYIVIGILIAILLCITIQSKLFVYRSLSGVSFIEYKDVEARWAYMIQVEMALH